MRKYEFNLSKQKKHFLAAIPKSTLMYSEGTNLFSISTNSVIGPLLPRATLAICCAAFAILSERFKQSKTL